MQGARTWTVGENLVWGNGPLSTPQGLGHGWMNSPPHRENLLVPPSVSSSRCCGRHAGERVRTPPASPSRAEYGYGPSGTRRKAKGKGRRNKSRKVRKKHRHA